MQITRVLRQHRQPMIKFLGPRTTPSKIDHTPRAHPASPADSLPESFASYRQKAQQHGPLNKGPQQSQSYGGMVGDHSGASLGPVEPGKGEVFDRSNLPQRFWRTPYTLEEMEAINSGGASLFA